MLRELFIMFCAHLGCFLIIRDILETTGIRAIEDANGEYAENYEENFAQGSGEYVVPKHMVTQSETLNYMFLGQELVKSLYYSVKEGTLVEKASTYVKTLDVDWSTFQPIVDKEGEPVEVKLIVDEEDSSITEADLLPE